MSSKLNASVSEADTLLKVTSLSFLVLNMQNLVNVINVTSTMFHANSTSFFTYSYIGQMLMVLLPKGDQIFFLCCLHNSICSINVMLQVDKLKKLISEGEKNTSCKVNE